MLTRLGPENRFWEPNSSGTSGKALGEGRTVGVAKRDMLGPKTRGRRAIKRAGKDYSTPRPSTTEAVEEDKSVGKTLEPSRTYRPSSERANLLFLIGLAVRRSHFQPCSLLLGPYLLLVAPYFRVCHLPGARAVSHRLPPSCDLP